MDKDFPKVLGMGDVAEMLGVSRQYVDKLIEQGKLRYQMTSTGKVFLEEDVKKYIKDK
jgi:excisionase family DNA binding protein